MTRKKNVMLGCDCGFDNSSLKYNTCPKCKANLKRKSHKNHNNAEHKRPRILSKR